MQDSQPHPIRDLFSGMSDTYERINHILTFGLDVLWRKHMIRIASEAGGSRWIDLCTGTGEIAVGLSRIAPSDTTIYAADFTLPMLAEAKRKPETKPIKFIASDITALPFPDNTFDLVTMSFATRNINRSLDILIKSFAGYHRILKPGGMFVNLETSRPPLLPVRRCFDFFVTLMVRPIGAMISGSPRSYAYLANSITRFYTAEELAGILKEAGFRDVDFRRQMFGAAAIHWGKK